MLRSTFARLVGARADTTRILRSAAVAAVAAVEALEGRRHFGLGSHRAGEDGFPGGDCPPSDPVASADPLAGGLSGAALTTLAPVRRASGVPRVTSVDLQPDAFGKPWGHVRSWTGLNETSQNGNGWSVSGQPYLVIRINQNYPHPSTLSVIDGGTIREFVSDSGVYGSTWVGRYEDKSTLAYYAPKLVNGTKVPGEFWLTDPAGNVTTFYDLPRTPYDDGDPGTALPAEGTGRLYGGTGYAHEPTNQWFDTTTGVRYDSTGGTARFRFGAFKSYTDASRRLTAATTYDADGNLTEVVRTDGSGQYERFSYEYTTATNTLGGSAPLLSKVSLQKGTSGTGPWTTVRSAEYAYYTGTVGNDTDKHGRFGDLKTVVVKDHQRVSGGEVVDQKYYRYTKLYGTSFTGFPIGGDPPNTGYRTRGPTDKLSTTGGGDTDFVKQSADDTVLSGLKAVFEGPAYARLAANRGDVSAFQDDLDADVNPYADHVFTYARTDPGTTDYPELFTYDTRYRVVQEVASAAGCSTCAGGLGTYKYEYHTRAVYGFDLSSPTVQMNEWELRFTEYLPDTTSGTWADNDQEIVYTNQRGAPLLRVLVDKHGNTDPTDDTENLTAYQYDADGRLVFTARPGAVRGYLESLDDLVGWGGNPYGFLLNDGLIEHVEYGSSTTAGPTTAGDVVGLLKGTYVRNGYGGTDVPVRTWQYKTHADGTTGAVVYPVVKETAYWDANRDGTDDAVDTTYAYTWLPRIGGGTETNRVESRTTTNPTVAAARNGSGSATVETTYYDAVGRPVWLKDADGFLSYTAYDHSSGAVAKRIVDVDSSQTSTFVGKPATWSTPAGGGLHLTTAYTVDGLGRTTKETDPAGNATFWVYLDANHEIRQYRSGPGTFAQVGPVAVNREYRPVQSAASGQRTVYNESLTTSATPALAGGVPSGTETLSASNIQSLTRSVTNDAGQLTDEYDYYSLSGVTYATATAVLGSTSNYHRTSTDYDGRGRVKRVQNAVGTVTRYLYDARGLLLQTWVGTDDTPTTGFWSPANTAGTDLVLVQENAYDRVRSFQEPPPAPTLSVGPTADYAYSARTYYVRVAYVNAAGDESLASAESAIALADGELLYVASPPAAGGATGYRVYVGTSPAAETLQADSVAAPVPLGTDFDEFDEPYTTTGRAPQTKAGVGDGLLSATVEHPTGSASATADRVTLYYHDWRGRLVAAKGGGKLAADGRTDVSAEAADAQRLAAFYDYDNLGRVTGERAYDADGQVITWSGGVPAAPASSLLRGKAETLYDDRGQVYQTKTYSVDPATGTPSTYALTASSSYDNRGNLLKVAAPGGVVTKYAYDGAGRVAKQYTTDGGGDAGWSDADDVASDKVLEQAAYAYDANGNVTLVTAKQRFHDETATGELGDAATAPKARRSYVASYYDAADRLTDTVDVGTNGGSAYTRPSSAPARSDTVLVTGYIYDVAGRVQDATDPRGQVTRTAYDLLGRATSVTEAYTDGTPSAADDRITLYTYDGVGHALTLTADLPTGSNDQVTQYVYGVTTAGGSSLASNDLLKEVRYPSKSTGAAGTAASDKKVYTYSALGEVKTLTDQNGTVHAYGYDLLGRLTADAVTTLGSGVDGAVRRLETVFDTQGLPYLMTSFNAASGGSVVNQVQRTHNGLGQVTAEYQAHSGAVSVGTTPAVQYAYTAPSATANHARITSMTYPNGRALRYEYAAGLDDAVSRVSYLADQTSGGGVGTHLEEYSYLGLGTIVRKLRPEPAIELTYVKQTGESNGSAGDQYAGLDRFGRVVDQRWRATGTGTHTDRFGYGYDRNDNPLYKANKVQASQSELYHANGATAGYDKLDRLTDFRRGTLSDANADGVPDTVTTAGRSQGWSLDALGNMSGVTTNGTAAGRTHDSRNELTAVGAAGLTFDGNGNTTKDDAGKGHEYDAWNHLVRSRATPGGTLQVTHSYDALGRRVLETPASGTATDLYYTLGWQVAEDRQAGATKAQYVWSQSYVNDLVARDRDADNNAGTGALGKTGSGLEQRLYAQQDANHNVTALVSTAGAVQQRFAYDPYGRADALTAAWAGTTDAYAWLYRHHGTRWVADPALYDVRERFYSPALMRFAQQDGGGYVDGANLYQGFVSSPVLYVDPDGRQASWWEVAKFMAGGGEDGTARQMWGAAGTGAANALPVAASEVTNGLSDRWWDSKPYRRHPIYGSGAGAAAVAGAALPTGRLGKLFDLANAYYSLTEPCGDPISGLIPFLIPAGGRGGGKPPRVPAPHAPRPPRHPPGVARSPTPPGCDTNITCFVAGTDVREGDGDRVDIEDVRVGDRLATDGGVGNTGTRAADPSATAVDRRSWRKVTVRAVNQWADGTRDEWRVETLQPAGWVRAHHAKPGAAIDLSDVLDLAEMGVPAGLAGRVVAVGGCPELSAGPGRVVLTTVTHLNGFVFDLTLRGRSGAVETLGVTGWHKFLDERDGWQAVADLDVGDTLRGFAGGDVTVVGRRLRPAAERVYNLTVEADHVYYVGDLTTLVHNDGCGSYTNTHASGKTYSGKGDKDRMNKSARQKAREHSDPVVKQDNTPAADDKSSFIDEQNRIDANGGPGGNSYNQINSPGKKLRGG